MPDFSLLGRGLRGEDTEFEHFVLLAITLDLRRPPDDLACRDDFMGPELLSGEVDLGAVGEAVPPVEVHALAVDVHLAKHQIAAQQVIDDEGGDAALAARGVLPAPFGEVFGRACVRTPSVTDTYRQVIKSHG